MNSFEESGSGKGEVITLEPQSFFDWDKIDFVNNFFEKTKLTYSTCTEKQKSEFDLNCFKSVLFSLLCNTNLRYYKLNTLLAFVFIKKLEKYENTINNPKDLVKFVAFIFISEIRLVFNELSKEGIIPDENSLNFLKLKIKSVKSMACEDSLICASNIFTLLNDQAIHFIYDYLKNNFKDFAKNTRSRINAKQVENNALQILKESKEQKVVNLTPPKERGASPKNKVDTTQIIPFPKRHEDN